MAAGLSQAWGDSGQKIKMGLEVSLKSQEFSNTALELNLQTVLNLSRTTVV